MPNGKTICLQSGTFSRHSRVLTQDPVYIVEFIVWYKYRGLICLKPKLPKRPWK